MRKPMKLYILLGPSKIGTSFGMFQRSPLKEGEYAIVWDAAYSNGGYGPCSADNKIYASREAAEAALAAMRAKGW